MSLYQEYRQHLQKMADLKNALAVLQWDQETYLPSKGASFRGQQIATLSELIHQQSTQEKLGNMLEELQSKDNLAPNEKKNVALNWDDFKKQKKYSSSFVRQLTETISKSFHAWIAARRENSFEIFEKPIHDLIELKK